MYIQATYTASSNITYKENNTYKTYGNANSTTHGFSQAHITFSLIYLPS